MNRRQMKKLLRGCISRQSFPPLSLRQRVVFAKSNLFSATTFLRHFDRQFWMWYASGCEVPF